MNKKSSSCTALVILGDGRAQKEKVTEDKTHPPPPFSIYCALSYTMPLDVQQGCKLSVSDTTCSYFLLSCFKSPCLVHIPSHAEQETAVCM